MNIINIAASKILSKALGIDMESLIDELYKKELQKNN